MLLSAFHGRHALAPAAPCRSAVAGSCVHAHSPLSVAALCLYPRHRCSLADDRIAFRLLVQTSAPLPDPPCRFGTQLQRRLGRSPGDVCCARWLSDRRAASHLRRQTTPHQMPGRCNTRPRKRTAKLAPHCSPSLRCRCCIAPAPLLIRDRARPLHVRGACIARRRLCALHLHFDAGCLDAQVLRWLPHVTCSQQSRPATRHGHALIALPLVRQHSPGFHALAHLRRPRDLMRAPAVCGR